MGFLAASALAFGCGDDSGNTDPKPDAPNAFVEAPIGLDAEDGGEIRIENLIFPDGISRTLTTAFFTSAQNGIMPFPNVITDNNMPLDCNEIGDEIYPFGDASADIGAPATWAPGGRVYMDVGPKITLGASDGSTPPFDLIGYENFTTPFLGGSYHDWTYNPDVVANPDPFLAVPAERMGGTGQNVEGQKLKVELPGGPDLAEARTFDFENGFSGIEIPPRPVVNNVEDANGDLKNFSRLGVPSEMDLSRSKDFTASYEVVPEAPADLLGFVAVFRTMPDVALVKLCVTAKPGKVIIPAATMNTMPSEGIMFIAHLLHRTRTLDNNRRIDMVGTACTATYFTMVP